MFRKLREGTPKEKGQTLVLVAVMMVVLLGLTAMAIDLSYVFVQRRNMQNAADSGALAGTRMLALYIGDPTMSYRYRDLYFDVLNAAQANGSDEITAFLVRCDDQNTFYELTPNDFGVIQRSPCPCGVYVTSEAQFGTFFSKLFGVHVLAANAEAQAEMGLPKHVRGVAPIALRNTVLTQGYYGGVGISYTFWDDAREGGANRGWLGLDCNYPDARAACNPDTQNLKRWMDPPYYTGQVSNGALLGGDPGVRDAVLHHADVGEVLIIPVFDYVYHYTLAPFCNPKDPKYNWSKCLAGEAYEGTIPVYTTDPGYNGRYYYHIVGFAAFKVKEVGSQGGDKYINGKLISYTPSLAEWQNPECLGFAYGNRDAFGVAVVKLTK